MSENLVSPKVRSVFSQHCGRRRKTLAKPLSIAANLRPLLEKQFDTAAYIFEEDPLKSRPPSLTPREKHARRATYDNEECILRTMEGIKVGGENGMTKIPEKLWNSMKQFTSQLVSSRRENAKQVEEKRRRLKNFEKLQDLEHELAELRSYRIELLRELATDEKENADSFQVLQKTQKALAQIDMLAPDIAGMFKHVFTCKLATDKLHSQLFAAKKYCMLQNTHHKPVSSSKRDETSHFQEGRVVFRAPRVFCDRPCVVTIYVHDLRMNHFRDGTPYAQPTITPVWQDDDPTLRASGGMSELFKTLLTEESLGGATSQAEPVYLIVVFDANSGKYYMIEHLPKMGMSIADEMDASVIAHVNAHLTLIEDCDGALKARMPGTNLPLRRIWEGTQEIDGDRPHEFLPVSILELNVRTWLVRVYDVALCKVYTHVLPTDENEDWEHLISIVRTRLYFHNGVLSMKQNKTKKRNFGDSETGKKAFGVLSGGGEDWPSSLVIKVSRELGDRIVMVSASVNPSINAMRITVSDYIDNFVVKSQFVFSDRCLSLANVEEFSGDRQGLVDSLRHMATMASSLADTISKGPPVSAMVQLARRRCTEVLRRRCVTMPNPANKGVLDVDEKTVFGITGLEYYRAMMELVNTVQLNNNTICFPAEPVRPKSPDSVEEELWPVNDRKKARQSSRFPSSEVPSYSGIGSMHLGVASSNMPRSTELPSFSRIGAMHLSSSSNVPGSSDVPSVSGIGSSLGVTSSNIPRFRG